jgi:2,4-dienoyl-CoA reductase-like NADH-dependent reductase (Old Yellow Enzyme family)
LEVVRAVRSELPPATPLLMRVSASEWVDSGWTIDDSVALARIVHQLGVDLIDASSGGNAIQAKIPLGSGYQVSFAERIRKETGILTGAVGLITTPDQAEAIVGTGQADVVFLARELLRDPYFPMHAAQTLGAEVRAPKQYLRAFPNSSARA